MKKVKFIDTSLGLVTEPPRVAKSIFSSFVFRVVFFLILKTNRPDDPKHTCDYLRQYAAYNNNNNDTCVRLRTKVYYDVHTNRFEMIFTWKTKRKKTY